MKKVLPAFVAFIIGLTDLSAIPVRNKSVTLTQPDGSIVYAVINGDEFSHTVKDLSGHHITKGSDGYWCYASFSSDGGKYSSGYPASAPAPAHILSGSSNPPVTSPGSTDKRLLMNRNISESGSILKRIREQKSSVSLRTAGSDPIVKHCLILLADFQDKPMTYTKSDFERMVKENGYSLYGASGSVDDYFNDQFQGDFELSYEISEVITLDNNCEWYFGNDSNGNDNRPDYAIAEACRKAAETGIDFSVFDDDDDGEVDNVFLFVAGNDEADGGGDDCVWSHMYYLQYSSSQENSNLVLNGKKINSYAISTEFRKAEDGNSAFASIGTFCHEYSHSLGLMDLYDTDYAGSGGYGNGLWYYTGLMDGGNENNYCNTPPHYNAIDYEIAGIGNPETLAEGSYTLEPISLNRRYLKMETNKEGEFFLIECRDNSGWDEYIGGKGMLIYHIDMSGQNAGNSDTYSMVLTAGQRWELNEVNCRPDRQCAELVSATPGIYAYTGDGYHLQNTSSIFYPSSDNDAFTSLTSPAFVFWDGTSSSLAITDIELVGDNVEFNVCKMSEVSVPEVKLTNTEVFQDAAIIQWEADDSDYTEIAYVSWGESDGELHELEVEPYESGKYAIVLDGLSPATAYETTIYFKDMGLASKEIQINFTTKSMYNGYPFIFLNSVSRNDDGSMEKGTMVPLRVYNANNAESVKWFMGSAEISVGGNGYYELNTKGRLRAVITYNDGKTETLMKEIKLN